MSGAGGLGTPVVSMAGEINYGSGLECAVDWRGLGIELNPNSWISTGCIRS